jgi:hypothetical protein
MRCNCVWGVVFFSPVGGDYSAQDLLGDPEKVFFILDFVGAHFQNGFLGEVFGRHAIFGFGIGGFYEHAAELLESFWLFKHLGGILYDGGEGARSIGLPLKFVLGIFVAQCASDSFAEWFGLKMAEI